MDRLKPLIEALIFASDQPLSTARIATLIDDVPRADITAALRELVAEYNSQSRGIYIEEVAGGWQIRTKPEYAPWIRRLFKLGPQKISRAALEVLSIVAYKQPITRAEIENIRGVDCAGVIKTLLEKNLIRIAGRKDAPGRPAMYGTTKEFLEVFGLKELSALPTLKEIEELEKTIKEELDAEGTTPEDNSTGGHNLPQEGRGTDTSGQG